MSNNIFEGKRFLLLWKQHFIQNNQLLILASVAFMGVVFAILTLAQIGNELRPHDFENFGGTMLGFVGIAGVLYVGHSFPALRSKENTMVYLMIPGSVLEKFLFEYLSRVGIVFIFLPILFWTTFHLQGYFITLFTEHVFEPIGLSAFSNKINLQDVDEAGWLSTMIITGVILGFTTAFAGSAMFSKQPLVKTLFALAMFAAFYSGFAYLVIEPLRVGMYDPPADMWLIPRDEVGVFRFFSSAFALGTIVMLFVAFRKLKEREV